MLGGLRESLLVCKHTPWLHSQEPGSDLGVFLGQQELAVEAWSKDKLEPMGLVYICPSLSLAAVTTASLTAF